MDGSNENGGPEQPVKPVRLRMDGQPDQRASNHYKRGPDVKTVNAEKLMPEVIKAVLGSKAMTHATQPLSIEGKRYLSQALKRDVDEWRAEFAGKLRAASEDLLDLTMKEMDQIPPAARAYTLAVLVDKAQVLEGKAAMGNAAVNVQINNFGNVSKDDLIKKLRGEIDELPVAAEPVDAA